MADLLLEIRRERWVLLFHVIPTSPVQINELNFSALVEKDVGFSQVTKDISLYMQVRQYLFKLGMSICWSEMRLNIVHYDHLHRAAEEVARRCCCRRRW